MATVDLEALYFDWLVSCLDPDGATEGIRYVSSLLHTASFNRRVGNDVNRANDGCALRQEFFSSYAEVDFDPHVTNALAGYDCSWLEMLVALSRRLDFLYDEGVDKWFYEMVSNLGLGSLMSYSGVEIDTVLHIENYHWAHLVLDRVNTNQISAKGEGGLFPIKRELHSDQRYIEIWEQHAAYISDRLI